MMTADGRTAAVLFDLDGTLLDTMTSAPEAYVRTIRSLGGPDVTRSDVIAAWNVGPTPAVLEHFLGRATRPDDIDCFFGHFEAAVATVRPFEGVVAMIDALDHEGYLLGVYTTATRRAATLMLASAGLPDRFAALVGGDEVSEPKPSPQGLRIACRMMRVDVADAAYVGDADVDLDCATAAGSLPIRACWGNPAAAVTGRHLTARRPDEVLGLVRRPAARWRA
jgi:phosphoglycolate phosphatase-like HAD superfamily hydrolase